MRKKLLLLIIFMGTLVSATAQFKKGGFITGGSLSFAYSRSSAYFDPNSAPFKTTETQFSLLPQVGYFLIDNLAVGIVGAVSTDNTQYSDQDSFIKIKSYTVGPFVRYYYQKFFASASYGIGRYHYDALGDGEYKYSNNVNNATFGVGYALLLNEFVALEPAVTYSLNKSSMKGDGGTYDTTGQFMLSLGIQFYIHK